MISIIETMNDPGAPAPAVGEPSGHTERERRLRTRNRARDVLTVCSWTSIAAAVALFLANGGAARFATLSGSYTGFGIVAGLVATDLAVIMLLLAARVPMVDRAIGHDHAIALHAKLGQWVFGGLVGHALLLLIGYALADRVSVIGEFASLWRQPDFVWAVVGLGLLTAVAVTSIVAVKRRFPHEVWQGIHLLSYLAIAASIPHQFSMGGVFAEGLPRWYWATLFLATAFCLLAFRVFLPVFASLEHRLVVGRVIPEGADAVSIEMTGRNLDRLDVAAGQFFHWRFLAPGLWWHQHPFSVSSAATPTTLRITVRTLGRGTQRLMRVRPGTRVLFEGPYGLFSDRSRSKPDVVMVAAGVGICPVRAVLEETQFEPGHGTVVMRAHSQQELYLYREVYELCRTKGARLIVLTGSRGVRPGGSPTWLPTHCDDLRLADLVPEVAYADLYVCGPLAFSELVIADAKAVGTPDAQIHFERFAW